MSRQKIVQPDKAVATLKIATQKAIDDQRTLVQKFRDAITKGSLHSTDLSEAVSTLEAALTDCEQQFATLQTPHPANAAAARNMNGILQKILSSLTTDTASEYAQRAALIQKIFENSDTIPEASASFTTRITTFAPQNSTSAGSTSAGSTSEVATVEEVPETSSASVIPSLPEASNSKPLSKPLSKYAALSKLKSDLEDRIKAEEKTMDYLTKSINQTESNIDDFRAEIKQMNDKIHATLTHKGHSGDSTERMNDSASTTNDKQARELKRQEHMEQENELAALENQLEQSAENCCSLRDKLATTCVQMEELKNRYNSSKNAYDTSVAINNKVKDFTNQGLKLTSDSKSAINDAMLEYCTKTRHLLEQLQMEIATASSNAENFLNFETSILSTLTTDYEKERNNLDTQRDENCTNICKAYSSQISELKTKFLDVVEIDSHSSNEEVAKLFQAFSEA